MKTQDGVEVAKGKGNAGIGLRSSACRWNGSGKERSGTIVPQSFLFLDDVPFQVFSWPNPVTFFAQAEQLRCSWLFEALIFAIFQISPLSLSRPVSKWFEYGAIRVSFSVGTDFSLHFGVWRIVYNFVSRSSALVFVNPYVDKFATPFSNSSEQLCPSSFVLTGF